MLDTAMEYSNLALSKCLYNYIQSYSSFLHAARTVVHALGSMRVSNTNVHQSVGAREFEKGVC